jgi:hypothetical protein
LNSDQHEKLMDKASKLISEKNQYFKVFLSNLLNQHNVDLSLLNFDSSSNYLYN